MISGILRLRIDDYCHGCPEFEEEVQREGFWVIDGVLKRSGDIFIKCKHRERCENIVIYLKEKMREELDHV